MVKQHPQHQFGGAEKIGVSNSAQQVGEYLDLRDLVVVLYRKIWLIAGIVAGFLAVAATFLVLTTPQFTATALLLVDPSQKNLLNPDEGFSQGGMSDAARVESEVEILRSGTVSLATVERLDLVTDPEFGPSLGLFEKLGLAFGRNENPAVGTDLLSQTLDRFMAATEIRRRGQTHLIAVSATSESATKAALLANTLAQTYIGLQIEAKVNMSMAARDLLLAQIEQARESLAQSEDALDFYVEQNLERLSREAGGIDIEQLRSELEDLRSLQVQSTAQRQALSSAYQQRDWAQIAQVLEDNALANLVGQREALIARLNTSTETTTRVDLQQELERLDALLDAEAATNLQSAKLDVDNLNAEVRSKQGALRSAIFDGNLSSATLAELYDLQQKADIAQRQYKNLLSRARDLDAQSLVQMADSRIVSEALPPRQPSFPKKAMVLSFAFVLALGVGVSAAFLSEFYFGGITSVAQLANVLPIPVGGAIPKVEQQVGHFSVADTVIQAPLSPYAESVRQLRASIDLGVLTPKGKCTVVMVTSAFPSEGKSSLALALARTYAVAGKSTLLVDTDLRKPSLHQYLGLTPQTGFFDYLRYPEKLAAQSGFYDTDTLSKVGVVLGRGRADVPTDQLLQSAIFERFLDKAREAMDVIILDTSPLLPVVDAIYIARHADVVLNCVRYGGTGQTNLREALDRLARGVQPSTPVYSVLTHNRSRGSDYENTYAHPGGV
ncbi:MULTISPECIES: GumC family protein [Halocynthiibacter]|uniref:Wzz/FepE/Etk N-terminal domain-containing protein n=1 Tax=Halocynthiibacter halioticoli TaxID=2986804 RepID=A0AAE3IW79_9RHOB|nr:MULTISPECIES: Wzz/FepE/Etk N-terminal domain-containing protein [Halocynthiibacter]MCV6823119.1 Wzz/FepE/Etk N-terminal domain-containing protein [Halocynthiibacter halioticoli]MCW4056120.1 Wzz/FepE/Etk N-terminal domain-containing protein [Halocynthiibacter sp. SDUM655004]